MRFPIEIPWRGGSIRAGRQGGLYVDLLDCPYELSARGETLAQAVLYDTACRFRQRHPRSQAEVTFYATPDVIAIYPLPAVEAHECLADLLSALRFLGDWKARDELAEERAA